MVMDLGALLVRACVHNHSEANCYCSLQPPEKEKYCAVWKRLLPSSSEIAKAASSSIVPSQGSGVSASSGLAQSPSVTAPSLEAPGGACGKPADMAFFEPMAFMQMPSCACSSATARTRKFCPARAAP